MAKASTPTLMPLEQYAAIIGIDPFHFSQIEWPENPARSDCRDTWLQYSHMWPDRASRESLARAIRQAEFEIAQELQFHPAPKFIEEEQHPYPKNRVVSGSGYNRIRFPSLHEREKTLGLDFKYLQQGGRRRVVELETSAPVTYTDTTGDGFNNYAEVTVTATAPDGAEGKEIAVFPDTNTEPENRIRSVMVSIADDGSITITGSSALFLDTDNYSEGRAIDGTNMSNFLDEVNIYRVYASTEGDDYAPVKYAWPRNDVTYGADTGTLKIWDPRSGIIVPLFANWDEDEEEWVLSCPTDEPQLIRVWYYAGWPTDSRGWLTQPMARAVAALATAKLNKPICGCGSSEELAKYWQTIPADREAIWRSYEQLECPFGPQFGAWEAYQICRRFPTYGGVSV